MAHPSTFYPQRTKTPTQKCAYKHMDVPKRRTNTVKIFLLLRSSYPQGPYSPFSLETVQIRSPAQPSRFPRYPCPFHLLYRDSNSGLIEGFVRWGIASYPGTFYGPHDISRLLSYFRYSQSILYHKVKSLLMKRNDRGMFCGATELKIFRT